MHALGRDHFLDQGDVDLPCVVVSRSRGDLGQSIYSQWVPFEGRGWDSSLGCVHLVVWDLGGLGRCILEGHDEGRHDVVLDHDEERCDVVLGHCVVLGRGEERRDEVRRDVGPCDEVRHGAGHCDVLLYLYAFTD